jgi:hypothetical protein
LSRLRLAWFGSITFLQKGWIGKTMSARDIENAPQDPPQPRAVAVREVVHAVVTSEASHELPYLARFAPFDDSWALRRLRRGRSRDEPLGFGIDGITALVTPVIWITVNEVAREFGTTAGDGMFTALSALLRRLLRRKPKAATIPPLTQPQQDKVAEMVQAELLKAKLSPHKAEAIANAIFRELSKGFASGGKTEVGPAQTRDADSHGPH